jgi:3-dehydroquinate synthase
LPDREYRSGLAEVVKYGAILDAAFFELLESHTSEIARRDDAVLARVIARSCELKAAIVVEDERDETGRRSLLNFGHTFAHAFETAAGYAGLPHGEAVARGMVCAARLAERLGRVDAAFQARLVALLTALGLPVGLPAAPAEELLEIMRHDKKAWRGQIRFILPVRLGQGEVVPLDDERDVIAVLTEQSA